MPHNTAPDAQQITARLIVSDSCDHIDFPRADTVTSLYELVEDDFERISVLCSVHIWFGENNRDRRTPNDRATLTVRSLLDDVADGTFATSPDERGQVTSLVKQRPKNILPIFGPCLITGVDAGLDPDTLPEDFDTWWTRRSHELQTTQGDRLTDAARAALKQR